MTVHHPVMDVPSGSRRRHHWTMVGVVLVGVVVALADSLISGGASGVEGIDLLAVLGIVGFVSVGALILDRRPGEPVGRICLGMGLLFCLAVVLRLVVILYVRETNTLPAAMVVIAVVASTLVNFEILLGGPLLIAWFPHRSTGRRQRRAEDLLLILTTLAVLSSTQLQVVEYQWIPNALNPLHIDGFPISAADLFSVTMVTYALTYLVTAIGLVGRYRGGGPIVRAQIRWFGASVAISLVFLLLISVEPIWEPLGEFAWSFWILSLLLPPIAIAIAILRYRLFDIDRIISNAIGYGLVTIVLFAVFAVVNVALISQVSPLVNNEGIAVAASTLLVAALFNPLRTRVQRTVDRRFHRARYDAERLVAGFSQRLRDELDLATVTADLVGTADATLAPASLAIWIREVGQ